MCAGPLYEYLWADGVRVKNPIKLSAPDYVEALFDWVEAQLDDPSVFPQRLGAPFPKDFNAVVKNILKRLFRVYAHMYHSHFRQVRALELELHLNTCFRHFVLFVVQFDLVEARELAPMKEVIDKMVQ
jgi:MOB kinase activator 1